VLVSSSAEGKAKRAEARTTIYKRSHDFEYQLKMQSSRQILSEVMQKAGYMPFCLRNLDDVKKARIGLTESVKQHLIVPYDPLEEKQGEVVAQFLFTALLLPSGNILKLTSYPFDPEVIQSDKMVTDPEVKKILSSSTKAPKKK
jgi:hypothetical protein